MLFLMHHEVVRVKAAKYFSKFDYCHGRAWAKTLSLLSLPLPVVVRSLHIARHLNSPGSHLAVMSSFSYPIIWEAAYVAG
jgi:hypothetical protein